MPKKKEIPKEDIKDAINQNQTTEKLAEKNEVSTRTFDKKIKEYQKGKLQLGYSKDTGDVNPPDISQGTAFGEQEPKAPPIDYDIVARGVISMIDGMLRLVSMMWKDMTYEALGEPEIKICVDALKGEPQMLEFIVKYGFNHIGVVFLLVGVFMPRIKVKKKEEKEKEQPPKESASEARKKDGLQKVTKPTIVTDSVVNEKIPTEQTAQPSEDDDKEFLEVAEKLAGQDISILDNSSPELFYNEPVKKTEDYGNPPKPKGKIGAKKN